LFLFGAKYGSFFLRRILKTTISSKCISFGGAADTKRTLVQKEEEMRKLVERLQILEMAQERQTRERR